MPVQAKLRSVSGANRLVTGELLRPQAGGMKRQITIADPDIGEEEARAVYEVVLSGWINEGKKVNEFEERFAQYVGTKHAVALFNGTAVLHAILLSHDIGPEDEVIVPSLTFVSTATSILHAGAKPVFADIDPQTYNIDPADIEHRINHRTRAIMPVHYAGQVADMGPILEIAARHGLLVFEDAAEAHGAEYRGKKVGGFGNAAMFSFTPTKNITTGEGGMLTTNDDYIAAKVRLLKNHGQERAYHHVAVGYNYRMTEMQAAMGIVQLGKLPLILQRKQANAAFLNEALSHFVGISIPYVAPDRNHAYMMYTIRISAMKTGISRDKLQQVLAERGIQTKVYFPPVHQQPIFRERDKGHYSLPVTDEVSEEILSLPFHSKLVQADLEYIAECVGEAVGSKTRIV